MASVAVTDRPRKHRVVDVGISATSYSEVVDYCRGWIDATRSSASSMDARYVCVTSVHGVIMAHDDREVRGILNEADIATPDGMPIVWALRSFGIPEQQRVYGPTLMLRLCESAAIHRHRVFLYGGTERSLEELQRKLKAAIPGLEIAGAYSPPFRALTREEDEAVTRQIIESGAELVFVGISTPKQERWMRAHRQSLPGVVMVGVGAAFDFHAGRVRQAPAWIQKHGFEWLFRLSMEPARLWRRYLLVTPRFLPLWALQWLRMSSGANTFQRQGDSA